MGIALAEMAREEGADVTLICGPVSINLPDNIRIHRIVSTNDLYEKVDELFPEHDALIMAAAPADYAPKKSASQKIKKTAENQSLLLRPTVDILKAISSKKRADQRIIGFALETENGILHAERKLKEKQLDMIVLNMPSEQTAFEHDTNQVTIIRPKSDPIELPLANKRDIASQLLAYIQKLW